MQVSALMASPQPVKTNLFTARKQPNSLERAPKQDSVSFCARPCEFLNKEIGKQSQVFKQELLSLFMSEKPFAENFKLLTNCLFKDFNFELKDIKEVKYADIVKNPPIVFSKVDFNSETPKTNLFINFDKIKKIRDGAVNPRDHFIKFTEAITNCVAENNEYNLISNLVDKFRTKLEKIDNIDLTAVDKTIKEMKNEHNLNINYKVLNINDCPKTSNIHYVRSGITLSGEYFSEFVIQPNLHKDVLLMQLPHEFTHLLDKNSIVFNKTDSKMHSLNRNKISEERMNGFYNAYYKNLNFFELPTKERKDVYDGILKGIIKNNPNSDTGLIIDSIENLCRDETFAYSKSRGVFEGYKKDKRNFPTGLFERDFLNYILSIKHDSAKIASL